jgi:predicted phosphodiesterase
VRYLILSDIHANFEALTAVLAAAEGTWDVVLNCGDLVGYGPDPDEVVDWSKTNCALVIRGNHDKACAGLADLDWFNPAARASAIWSASVLRPENLEWLSGLPSGPADVESFAILHGSPADEDEYITEAAEADEAADHLTAPLSFFGHTHIQGGFQIHRNGTRSIPTDRELVIEESSAWLVNPGSVGQPRDRNPDAAWATYDSDERLVRFHRTPYDVERTRDKIVRAGLPEILGLRLYVGF